jgi:8-oxo-dGTP pyrophosphatase MutT (NUDIX family)
VGYAPVTRAVACGFSPGGVLEPSDAELRQTDAGRELDTVRSAQLKLSCGGLDYEQAARRECLEEVALTLSGPLVYFDHWLTPPGLAQRFDTRFFLAEAPAGQTARIHDGEAEELRWLRPADALVSGLKLLPVTQSLLQRLQPSATIKLH